VGNDRGSRRRLSTRLPVRRPSCTVLPATSRPADCESVRKRCFGRCDRRNRWSGVRVGDSCPHRFTNCPHCGDDIRCPGSLEHLRVVADRWSGGHWTGVSRV